MLVVLDVAEDARLDGNVEIVALVGAYGDEAGAHDEAVHLAAHAAVHVGDFVRVEVVACRERDVPVFGGPEVAVEAQVMRPLALVFELFLIEGAVAVVERIVEGEAPREVPFHVSVGL